MTLCIHVRGMIQSGSRLSRDRMASGRIHGISCVLTLRGHMSLRLRF